MIKIIVIYGYEIGSEILILIGSEILPKIVAHSCQFAEKERSSARVLSTMHSCC